MTDKWNEPEQSSGRVQQVDDNRAWSLVESLAEGALKEQRRARRWGIFFKLLTFSWLFLSIGLIYTASQPDTASVSKKSGSHTALVEISGQIGGGDVNADDIIGGLRRAFKDTGTQAVILRINSPGGSPVQSGYVYDEIKRLRVIYPDTPLYAVIMDLGASGGYYIASAADEIYADKASLVGSIGVISSGFGFVEAIDKLGVTRRTYTSGENKAFLDPFQPMNKQAADKWQASLNQVHQQFITAVKNGRGDRLSDDPDLFTGMIWSGESALALGLVDGLGNASYVAREIVKEEEIVDFTSRLSTLEKFAKDIGVSASASMVKMLGADGMRLQ